MLDSIRFFITALYPVDRIITTSHEDMDMYQDKYDIEYVPLNDWAGTYSWGEIMRSHKSRKSARARAVPVQK